MKSTHAFENITVATLLSYHILYCILYYITLVLEGFASATERSWEDSTQKKKNSTFYIFRCNFKNKNAHTISYPHFLTVSASFFREGPQAPLSQG